MDEKFPIKILQVGMTRNLGGLETYLMQQFQNLDRNKIIYDFVNITNEYEIVFADEIKRYGSKIYGICSRHKNPIKHYWQWYRLLKKRRREYKAIVLNTNSLEYIFPVFIGKIMGIPMRVIHSHNGGYENRMGILRKLLVFFNSKLMKWGTTDYLACSQLAGEWMFGRKKNFTVVHNAINVKAFTFNEYIREEVRKELNIEKKFVIGHVGRFVYQKDHDFLIRVFSKVYEKNKDAYLLLVGDYIDEDIFYYRAKEKVEQLGLSNAVLFLGMRKDVNKIMQAMDCFVLPSRFEGLAVVGIEAQASGLPCFFSDSITTELDVVYGLCNFLNKENELTWAEEILKKVKYRRENTSDKISKAGYNIKNEVKKITDFYLNR